ncbi:MAG TPA: glycosyl transferase family 1, partial [Casimicrobiaceae bacterium]|nr:glycosyl transferase family 1 [Casimicrobiaceae bacterium]
MNILFICHRFPFPPKRGGKIRPFNIIRHFARNHDVTVCSLVRSAQEAEEGEGIGEHCNRHEMVRVSDPVQALRMVAR